MKICERIDGSVARFAQADEDVVDVGIVTAQSTTLAAAMNINRRKSQCFAKFRHRIVLRCRISAFQKAISGCRIVFIHRSYDKIKAVFFGILLRKMQSKSSRASPLKLFCYKKHGYARFPFARYSAKTHIAGRHGSFAYQKMLFIGIIGGK